MPVTLTVNNIPYEYPVPGDSPGWGQPATDWATEVTLVLNELLGSTDIVQTPFAIANNITSSTSVVGLSFNTGLVRAAFINYSIYRTYTASGPVASDVAEAGQMIAVYDNLAATGSKWSLTIGPVNGNSGVTFTITDSGQIQYTSTSLGISGGTGVMRFSARTLSQ